MASIVPGKKTVVRDGIKFIVYKSGIKVDGNIGQFYRLKHTPTNDDIDMFVELINFGKELAAEKLKAKVSSTLKNLINGDY